MGEKIYSNLVGRNRKDVCVTNNQCVNISCGKSLSQFHIDRQEKRKKYRFCKRCLTKGQLRWKCVKCGNVMNSNTKRLGTYYCSDWCDKHVPNKKPNVTSDMIKYRRIRYNIKKLVEKIRVRDG